MADPAPMEDNGEISIEKGSKCLQKTHKNSGTMGVLGSDGAYEGT